MSLEKRSIIIAIAAVIGISVAAAAAPPFKLNKHATVQSSVPTLIAPARAGRQTIMIEKLGTTDVGLGGADVLPSNGMLLRRVIETTITTPDPTAIYGITAGGTQEVAFEELYSY